MKKLLFLFRQVKCILSVLALAFFAGCQSDPLPGDSGKSDPLPTDGASAYYWYRGEKFPLDVLPTKQFVLYKSSDEGIVRSRMQSYFTTSENESVKEYYFAGTDMSGTNAGSFSDYRWSVIETPTATRSAALIADTEEIVYSAPFYSSENGEVGISNLFYVKLKNESQVDLITGLAGEHNIDIIGKNIYSPLWYTLACTNDSSGNALEMANFFYESGIFDAAEPAKMLDLRSCVNDPLFSYQWNLKNNTYPGVDINFCNARSITRGKWGVIVAVIDTGIYRQHVDIGFCDPSYDTHSGAHFSQLYGDHGTQCAGIIGAVENNNMGPAGIAPNVYLMDISHNLYPSPNAVQELANGIRFAANNRASVISNSWGGNDLRSALLDEAISYALTEGRNGKGCCVVFASGNDIGGNGLSTVSYPANSNPDIIAVGAIAPDGKRKSLSSMDGEWWGSNYGVALDVVAPGVFIPTTTRTGGYTTQFGGTSAACPHVAAIAALILSVNNELTQKEVADIIERTAKKVGGYGYSTKPGRPNGIWHEQMGYGLVDAYAALCEVYQPPLPEPNVHISSPDNIQCGVPFTASLVSDDGDTFESIEWELLGLPDEKDFISGQGTPTVSMQFDWAGFRTLRANYKLGGDSNIYTTEAKVGYACPEIVTDTQIFNMGVFSSDFFGRYVGDNTRTGWESYVEFEITRPMWVVIHNLYSSIAGVTLMLGSDRDDFDMIHDCGHFGDFEVAEEGYYNAYYQSRDALIYPGQGFTRKYLLPGNYCIICYGYRASNAGISLGPIMTTVKGFVNEPPVGTY